MLDKISLVNRNYFGSSKFAFLHFANKYITQRAISIEHFDYNQIIRIKIRRDTKASNECLK